MGCSSIRESPVIGDHRPKIWCGHRSGEVDCVKSSECLRRHRGGCVEESIRQRYEIQPAEDTAGMLDAGRRLPSRNGPNQFGAGESSGESRVGLKSTQIGFQR